MASPSSCAGAPILSLPGTPAADGSRASRGAHRSERGDGRRIAKRAQRRRRSRAHGGVRIGERLLEKHARIRRLGPSERKGRGHPQPEVVGAFDVMARGVQILGYGNSLEASARAEKRKAKNDVSTSDQ